MSADGVVEARGPSLSHGAAGDRKRDVGMSWLDVAVWAWPSTRERAVTAVSPRTLTTSDVGTRPRRSVSVPSRQATFAGVAGLHGKTRSDDDRERGVTAPSMSVEVVVPCAGEDGDVDLEQRLL